MTEPLDTTQAVALPPRSFWLEEQRLWEAVAAVMRLEAIPSWLDTPNSAFDGLKPLEVVERGQIDRLWRMLFELESGVAA